MSNINSDIHAQTAEMTAAGLNLIAQALTIYDHNLRLAVCNAPFQQMFELPDALVTPGAPFADTIQHLAERGDYGPITDIPTFVAERVTQARTFEPHYMERTRPDGSTISVEGSPLPTGGWVTVYTDITATKRQEALLRARSDALSDQVLAHAEQLSATNRELAASITALEETKRQLTASEARMRLTAEMTPAHIAHVSSDGRYTYSNRKLSSVMPGHPSDILGQRLADVMGSNSYARIKPALDTAYSGKPAVLEFADDISAHRIRAAFTPDTVGGVYILSMDITEETQTREALQQTRKRALAAQMISGLAHDFSNLLTIILGLQSQLGQQLELPLSAVPLIDGTTAAARRGGILLSTIADVTGPRTLRPTATYLAPLMHDLATLAAPTLPEALKLDIIQPIPTELILLDKGMVQDCLLNLILNARDACGATGWIQLQTQIVRGTWVEWQVRDTGSGFSEEALARGFDPFFTTKGAEGSGLGLSMAYDMAKLSGGDLRLSNGPNGAVVTLRLPYRPAVAATTGLVLLVEDHDELRALVRDMLMDMGHSVIEAASADEAAALIADLPDITLILSDIQLAGAGTGLDLAARRAADGPALVFMTSLPTDAPLFRHAQQLAPVLRKPFTADDLNVLIRPEGTRP